MKILAIRPAPPGADTVAYVDVDVGGLTIFDVEVKRAADGSLRAWPSRRGRRATVSLSAELIQSIIRAALPATEGNSQYADACAT